MSIKVFVSGGAGVIGRPLVGGLLQLGAEILVGDLKPRPSEWPKSVQYWQGDLNRMDGAMLAAFDPDLCFHLAAAFERTEENPEFLEENFYHNILLSHALLHALQKCTRLKKVIFASSYLVYDPTTYLFDRHALGMGVLQETSPINPRNLCGMAKLLHEKELSFAVCKKRFSALSARIFRVYGKGSNDVISRWVREGLQGKEITVYGKEGAFDYIYADDVAEGLIRLARTGVEGIVNLGTGHSRRVGDVLQILKGQIPALNIQEVDGPERLECSQANMNSFQRAVGWVPGTTLEKGIPKIIAYERQ